ncbi:MAG: OB-fold nucleic acid binding domain-containing protein [bacterium]|nr:OB-fold nucleic acid binding domain-containing protein [bacterium]
MDLNSLLINELRLNEYQKRALNKLGFKTAKDLLWHFPSRYEKFAPPSAIADVNENEKSTVCGRILKTSAEKTWRRKMNIAEAVLSDGTGVINLVWFHQPYIARYLKIGDAIAASGKIQKNKKGFYIANPVYENINPDELKKTQGLIPVYPETRGLSSRWFRFAVRKILKKILEDEKKLKDPIPDFILRRYHLPSLKNALIYIHMPKNVKDAEAGRKRFSFEEVFAIQLSRLKQRMQYNQQPCFSVKPKKEEVAKFLSNFSFDLTSAQKKAIDAILKDFSAQGVNPRPISLGLRSAFGGKNHPKPACAQNVVKMAVCGDNRNRLQVFSHYYFG